MYLLTIFAKWSFRSSSPETELGEGRPSSPRLNHYEWGRRVGWGGGEEGKCWEEEYSCTALLEGDRWETRKKPNCRLPDMLRSGPALLHIACIACRHDQQWLTLTQAWWASSIPQRWWLEKLCISQDAKRADDKSVCCCLSWGVALRHEWCDAPNSQFFQFYRLKKKMLKDSRRQSTLWQLWFVNQSIFFIIVWWRCGSSLAKSERQPCTLTASDNS